jgi:hypothetical protein
MQAVGYVRIVAVSNAVFNLGSHPAFCFARQDAGAAHGFHASMKEGSYQALLQGVNECLWGEGCGGCGEMVQVGSNGVGESLPSGGL